MNNLAGLKAEICERPLGRSLRWITQAQGYSAHMDEPNVIARAYSFRSLLDGVPKHLYKNDLIAGSVRGMFRDGVTEDDIKRARKIVDSYGRRSFVTNYDHFAPDYEGLLADGIGGKLAAIDASAMIHKKRDEREFLQAAKITMLAFSDLVTGYAKLAEAQGRQDISDACRAVALDPPKTFRQALQLMWLCHLCSYMHGRYAMAIGRMDQFLYPFYAHDIAAGILDREAALALVECTLYKIHEATFFGGDDVVNIAIGGVKRDGSDAINELTYVILQAVENCGVPGPNLSARFHKNAPPEFLDSCLRVIGTGLGYPALMNDEINIPALARQGYGIENARDYCMVGCIENFMPGKQPPWSDGRYNTPKYVELALNNGVCMLTGARLGPETGAPETLTTMHKFIKAVEAQMKYGAAEYMMYFRNENSRCDARNYQQPFLSCLCRDCIGRAKDICRGGALFPSVHGAGCMGIGTVADSLAATEQIVYKKKLLTLSQLRDILAADFEGYENERRLLLNVPKYGNDCPETDKYAEWFVETHNRIFSKYRTPDGGAIYTAIASNVANIPAGEEVAATPDGRHAGQPVSDAASPMHGMDKNGPTAVVNSLTKPDYTLVSCGTVVNQKYSPEMFSNPENRAKLAALIRVYFEKGGQEMQINSVSRGVLADAMEHPENYENLVVRVSGFSAYYTRLNRKVQQDILKRTEQG